LNITTLKGNAVNKATLPFRVDPRPSLGGVVTTPGLELLKEAYHPCLPEPLA